MKRHILVKRARDGAALVADKEAEEHVQFTLMYVVGHTRDEERAHFLSWHWLPFWALAGCRGGWQGELER